MTDITRRRAMQLGMGATLGMAAGSSLFASRAFGQDRVKLINVEHDSRPLDNAAYQAVYAAFRERHPNVELEFEVIPWEQARPKLLTLAQANDLPDVGRVSWAQDFGAMDMLVPIEDRTSAETLSRFDPLMVQQGYGVGTDGQRHLYSIPWFVGSHSILVNQTLLEQAGLSLKDSWTTDEFTEYCKALTIDGKQWGVAMNGAGIGDPVQIFLMCIYAFGGKWVAGDPTSTEPERIVFDSPESVAGLEWYTNLYKAGYALPSTPTDTYKERDANFQSGRAVMAWQGPWSLVETRENLRKGGWELASMPLPIGPSGRAPTSVGGGLAGVFSGAAKRGVVDEAYAWVDFLTSDEGQSIYCKTNGMIPASSAVQADPFWSEDPLYKGFLGSLKSTEFLEPIWATGHKAILDDVVAPTLQGVLLGQLTAAEGIKQIQNEVVRGLVANGVDLPRD
jgi:multiple sugar transport system substrate-binding protein